ncbi:MAG: hypothetical protein HOB84_13595 [Candidatus Marinimicrobia bacterium]|nr:hypothetical protein [Candidatus Neomarinimicrobiota bacterium]MBT4945602.1 hypothetical protein [Candidatus Neomarinimicrobiota bacterium]MBT5314079.1 hypothetical protein [Candidatus Neomarinimicrobiota bacterium]
MQEYAFYIIFVAIIAFVTGLLLVSSPKTLIKTGELFNRVYNVESVVYTKRVPFGFAYIIFGGILLFILW